MAAERIKSTDLGIYLDKKLIEKNEIYFKTGIIISKLSKLCNSQLDLHADDFYRIALSFNADIDEMAEFVFRGYTVRENLPAEFLTNKSNQKLSKYGQFLQEFLITQKLVAAKIGIDEGRIGKIMKVGSAKKLLAVEVYLTAKVFNRSVKEAFNKICGDLTLNSSIEEQRLRDLSKSKKSVKG